VTPVDPAHLAWANQPVASVRNALYGGNSDGTWMIRLNASAAGAPLPVVVPSAIDMGNIDIGTSSTATINLSNAGTAAWQVLTYVPTPNPMPAVFTIFPGTCGVPPFQIAPGSNCDIDVVFKATSHGLHAASVEIAGNTPPGSATFLLRGIGSLFASGFE